MVKRSGARAGDRIVVTGTVGDAAFGLALRREPALAARYGLSPQQSAHLRGRYLLPEPRVALAAALRAHASAAIDISDGLAGDLMKLAAASGVAARVEAKRLPLSPAAQKMMAAEPAFLETVLSGGDDYEVLAAVSPAALEALQGAAKTAGIALSEIGAVSAGAGVEILGPDSRPIELSRPSFSHF
jgi:thiamine-monophosphate kinase